MNVETYNWKHSELPLERQQEILEQRREYLLQLLPDQPSFKQGEGRAIFSFHLFYHPKLGNLFHVYIYEIIIFLVLINHIN